MRLTFRREPNETGLARVCQSPRGWILKADGEEVAIVAPLSVGFHTYRGWYWYVMSSAIPSRNTCRTPVATPEEAKTQCKAYVVECLKMAEGKSKA